MPPGSAAYSVCPCCARAVPARAGEAFCGNDGARMLHACPRCHHPILSPYARFCSKCGALYAVRSPSPGGTP